MRISSLLRITAELQHSELLIADTAFQAALIGSAWKHTVIIDAGSTGSRIHIYQYKASRAGLAVVQQPVSSLKVTPGLSDYAGQPENVGLSLGPLLEYAYKQVMPSSFSLSMFIGHIFLLERLIQIAMLADATF